MPSRKLVLAVAVATAGVTLIGLGVRASFTSQVNVNQTIATGNINALITDATWSVFEGEGYSQPVEVGGAPFSPGVGSLNIGISSNNGSSYDTVLTITVVNTGSLDMSLNCVITPGASDSTGLTSELGVFNPLGGEGGFEGLLSDVESNGVNVCAQNVSSDIPPGGSITQSVEIFADNPFEECCGELDNSAMGQSITPKLTVSGNDINDGFGNQPTP